MAPEWFETTIGDQTLLQRGFDITKAEQRAGQVPVVSSGGVSSYHDVAAVKGPGVVLGRKGVVGSVYFIKEDFWPHDTSLWVKDFKGNDPEFVYYFFRSIAASLSSLDVGSANPTLNRNHVHPLRVVWPDIKTQRAVAGSLAALDGRIDNLRQTNATLEAIAQALFKSWFVDFDAVRAKAEGREPEGMGAATAALFPSEFEDSELGLIPKGWRAAALAEISVLNESKWTTRCHPKTVRYIDLSGVTANKIQAASEYLFEEAPSRARHHLRDGDTIVGTVRPGNRAFAYIHSPEPNLTGSTGFAVLSPKLAHMASFIYLAATRDDSIDRLANLADGGAYPAVRPGVVADTPSVIPSDDVLVAFSGVTKPVLERISQNSVISATLASLRDTLLPRLISGKLRLPEATEAIEAALA